MIYINNIDDNVVWVTTDEDAIGLEVRFDSDALEDEKPLIALTEYLGYEPASVLCLDSMDNGIRWTTSRGGAV